MAFLALTASEKRERATKTVQSASRRWRARAEAAKQRRKPSKGPRASLSGKTGQERRALLRDMSRFDGDHPRPPLAPSVKESVPEEPEPRRFTLTGWVSSL